MRRLKNNWGIAVALLLPVAACSGFGVENHQSVIFEWDGFTRLIQDHGFPCDKVGKVVMVREFDRERSAVAGQVDCDNARYLYNIVWLDGEVVDVAAAPD